MKIYLYYIGPPTTDDQVQVENRCATRCFQRIVYKGYTKDYYFDRSNGCVSKGWQDPSIKMFDSCCDMHNQCLNNQCCTTKCQDLKNDCDFAYFQCLKRRCYASVDFNENLALSRCEANAIFIANTAINRTCHATADDDRKVCFC